MEPTIIRDELGRMKVARLDAHEITVTYHGDLGTPRSVMRVSYDGPNITDADSMSFDRKGRLIERLWGRSGENHLRCSWTDTGLFKITFRGLKIEADLLFDDRRLVDVKYFHFHVDKAGPAYYRVTPVIQDLCMFFEWHSKGTKRVKSIDAKVEAVFTGPSLAPSLTLHPVINYNDEDTAEGMPRKYGVADMVEINPSGLT